MSILFLFCLDVNKFAISLHLNFTVTEKTFFLFGSNVVDCFLNVTYVWLIKILMF